MFIYLMHTDWDDKRTLYSFMSHVPKNIEKTELSEIEIDTSKEGIRQALQEAFDIAHAAITKKRSSSFEEGGRLASSPEPSSPDSQLQTREQFEQAWDSFPLALKLHYAALATDEARTKGK